jgi:predicted anti-sigma-YlaC factor YlaD
MRLARELTCSQIVELITDYLEGGLSAEDRERFEEHLGFCDPCVTYFDQMRETIVTVGRLGADDDGLSPELQEDLLRAFRDWSGS